MVRRKNQSIRELGNRLSLKSLKNLIPLLLVLICITACSGGDTEVEVIPEPEVVVSEPEPVEQPVQRPEPEPVVEIVYVPTLESWGIEDGELKIVDGVCDPSLFEQESFPHPRPPEKILNQKSIGGPDCFDDDPEGSRVDVPCVYDHSIDQGRIYMCRPDHEAYCMESVEKYDYIDTCVIQPAFGDDPNEPWNVSSGYTNFHDNVFRRNNWYLNARGEERSHNVKRSFMMVPTRNQENAHRGCDVCVTEGIVYGAYNPCSQEYQDRKTLYEACGRKSAEPPVYQTCEDLIGDPEAERQHERQSPASAYRIPLRLGKFQSVYDKNNGYREVCIRLDSMPGSVKCLRIPETGESRIELNGYEILNEDQFSDRKSISGLKFWGLKGRGDDLCEFFDEG